MIVTTDSGPETEVPGSVLDLQGLNTDQETRLYCVSMVSTAWGEGN